MITNTEHPPNSRHSNNTPHNLESFHSVQITVESAQNVNCPVTCNDIYCVVTILNSDDKEDCVLQTDMAGGSKTDPIFNNRLIMIYNGQRRMQFALWATQTDQEDKELGKYILDLTPFSETKKSLAAKMKIKNNQLQEAGFLNVKVKMCNQVVTSSFVHKRPPHSRKEITNGANTAQHFTFNRFQALHILVLEGDYINNNSFNDITERNLYVHFSLGTTSLFSELKPSGSLASTFFDCVFSASYNHENQCTMELWNHVSQANDDLIGMCTIDLASLLNANIFPMEHDITLNLIKPGTGESVGTLRFIVGLTETGIKANKVLQHNGLKQWRSIMGQHETEEDLLQILSMYSNGDLLDDHGNESRTLQWESKEYLEKKIPLSVWKRQCTSILYKLYCIEKMIDPNTVLETRVSIGTNCKTASPVSMDDSGAMRYDAVMTFPYDGERYAIIEILGDTQNKQEPKIVLGRSILDLGPFFCTRGNVYDGSAEIYENSHENSTDVKTLGKFLFRLEKQSSI